MKPAAFTYHRPATLMEALELLDRLGGSARILAGGQSLVPLLNMRLARPEHLVDINGIAELADVVFTESTLRVGALVRHSQVEDDPRVAERIPLLHEAVRFIGHRAIRNRGTVVGSLVHADPAAELPVVFLALDGRIEARSQRGTRRIPASEFFLTAFTTGLAEGELAVAAEFPLLPPYTGSAFVEFSYRDGDFAVASVAAVLTLDEDGHTVRSARVVVGGIEPVPRVMSELSEILVGNEADAGRFVLAARLAAEVVDAEDDTFAPADYRRHLTRGLVERALRLAAQRGGVHLVA